MNYYILFSLPILALIIQTTDSLFLFKNRNRLQQSSSDDSDIDDNNIGGSGGGGSLRWVSVLMNYITENKPELLPILTEIAVQNPQLLRLVIGGLTKRDTTSQVEYNEEEQPVDPVVVRRMFEYVLDNDNDDCFKKFACGLTKNNKNITTDMTADELIGYNLAEDNEAIDIRQECSQRFTRCSFKEYKTRDTMTEDSERQLRQMSGISQSDLD